MAQQAKSKSQNNTNTWVMLCHLTALAFLVGIPFGNIIGPLVIWLVKKDEMKPVDEAGKESLNFQISMTIYAAVAAILSLIVIGVFLLIAIVVVDVVLVIMAAVKTNNGEKYIYPLTIRLIK